MGELYVYLCDLNLLPRSFSKHLVKQKDNFHIKRHKHTARIDIHEELHPPTAKRTTSPSINSCWGRCRTIYPITSISTSSVSEHHRVCGAGGLRGHYPESDTFLLVKTGPVCSTIGDTTRCRDVAQMLFHTCAHSSVCSSVASSVHGGSEDRTFCGV